MFLNPTKRSAVCDNVNISCGIFQGDSLSSLLFCLPVIPFADELNNTKNGYEIYIKDHQLSV